MKKILTMAILMVWIGCATFAACPEDKPIEDTRGRCHACDEKQEFWDAEKENCERCPNRYFRASLFEKCLFKTCPKDKPIKDDDGECYSCDELSSIEDVKAEECAKCPNRKMKNGQCILLECLSDNPMRSEDGSCLPCEEGFFGRISETECAKCPNMKMINGKCSLKECPPDAPIRDLDGGCHSCRGLYSFIKVSAEECRKCQGYMPKDDRCILSECPEDKPIRDQKGECNSCDSNFYAGQPSMEECTKCPNRIFKNGSCRFKECPKHRPVMDKDGKCYDCDFSSLSDISAEECAKCQNKKVVNGVCVSAEDCPADKPIRSFSHRCFSCDDSLWVDFPAEECAKCPNREMFGDKCVLKECPYGTVRDDVSGMCQKERKIVIDEQIQSKNKPKWDYLKKDIDCNDKDVCFDKKKKKINGIVREEMFDFYVTLPYVNGHQKGDAKFYTQKGEFIASASFGEDGEPRVPLGNKNFTTMMEKVSKDQYKVVDLMGYLSSCKMSYERLKKTGKTTCRQIEKEWSEPLLTKGKDITIKSVDVSKNKKKQIVLELPKIARKYEGKMRERLLPSEKLEKAKDGHFILYSEDY